MFIDTVFFFDFAQQHYYKIPVKRKEEWLTAMADLTDIKKFKKYRLKCALRDINVTEVIIENKDVRNKIGIP